MSIDAESLRRLIAAEEGQYFDRKSLFAGAPGAKKQRDRRAVRDEVAEYVAGFANADGGTLVLGVEDDGTPTGCPYADEAAVQALLDVPRLRLRPPLRPGYSVELDGQRLLVFEVIAAPHAVMVEGNGFPVREGDALHRGGSEEFINQRKSEGLLGSPEARLAPGSVGDLDLELIQAAMVASGFAGSVEDYLVERRLADRRGETLALRQAAVWLFARSPGFIQHPNLGVRVFRVHGTEQKSGERRNVQDFPWIDDNLVRVLERARTLVDSLVRKSTRLHDLFFKETPEYPPFAWQEALVNALAHRDYSVEGLSTEVHVYDDRMEITSPGELLPEVKVEDLEVRRRVHRTRNPRLCRVLAELGILRQQGEGIPRIFEEMEDSWLPSPELRLEHGCFKLVLRNAPVFDIGDEEWSKRVRGLSYSTRQRRALVAFHDRVFQSGDYQRLNGVDRDAAYRELLVLEGAGLLVAEGATRGRQYRVVKHAVTGADAGRVSGLERLNQALVSRGFVTSADYQEAFGVSRHQASRALGQHVARGELIREGEGRGARYSPGTAWPPSPEPDGSERKE